jgi:hypothetical protein
MTRLRRADRMAGHPGRQTDAARRRAAAGPPADADLPESDQRCRLAAPLPDGAMPMYLTHWSTCPVADRFTTRKAGVR